MTALVDARPCMMAHSSLEAPSICGSRRWQTWLVAVFIVWPLSAPVTQERVLRFHHRLPEKSPQHQDICLPWARKIAQASNGRLRVNLTAAMQLGGKPAELITQVEGHQVDIVWTLPGYTPGK